MGYWNMKVWDTRMKVWNTGILRYGTLEHEGMGY